MRKDQSPFTKFSCVNNTVVILNPAANSDRAQRLRGEVGNLAGDSMICETSAPGEAETLARHAVGEGFEKIVAAGGDGTINEVVNGLAGSNATLGLLPMGTVNVFAMELGLPSNNLASCWQIIEGGNTRLVDLPSANGKYFVQLAGVGLDAQVVKETSATLKRKLSDLRRTNRGAQTAPPLHRIGKRFPQRRIVCPDRQWPPLWRSVSFFQTSSHR